MCIFSYALLFFSMGCTVSEPELDEEDVEQFLKDATAYQDPALCSQKENWFPRTFSWVPAKLEPCTSHCIENALMENIFTAMPWVGGATTTSFTTVKLLWKSPLIAMDTMIMTMIWIPNKNLHQSNHSEPQTSHLLSFTKASGANNCKS